MRQSAFIGENESSSLHKRYKIGEVNLAAEIEPTDRKSDRIAFCPLRYGSSHNTLHPGNTPGHSDEIFDRPFSAWPTRSWRKNEVIGGDGLRTFSIGQINLKSARRFARQCFCNLSIAQHFMFLRRKRDQGLVVTIADCCFPIGQVAAVANWPHRRSTCCANDRILQSKLPGDAHLQYLIVAAPPDIGEKFPAIAEISVEPLCVQWHNFIKKTEAIDEIRQFTTCHQSRGPCRASKLGHICHARRHPNKQISESIDLEHQAPPIPATRHE